MKRFFLILILLIIGTPTLADGPARCPCFSDTQVAALCINDPEPQYSVIGSFFSRVLCTANRGDSYQSQNWAFVIVDYEEFGVGYACSMVLINDGLENRLRNSIKDARHLTTAEVDQCFDELASANAILGD